MIEEAGAEVTTEKHDGFILALSDWKVWWLAFSMMALVAALSYHVYVNAPGTRTMHKKGSGT